MIRKFLLALLPVLFAGTVMAKELPELDAARRAYVQAAAKDGEAARLAYVEQLAKMLERYFARFVKSGDRDDDATAAIEAELGRHPAPVETDGAKLAKLLPGKWQTPRHEFLYRADGTYHMIPFDAGEPVRRWKIKGNQYLDFLSAESSEATRYTIILLNQKHFVYRDKDYVFFQYRLGN